MCSQQYAAVKRANKGDQKHTTYMPLTDTKLASRQNEILVMGPFLYEAQFLSKF